MDTMASLIGLLIFIIMLALIVGVIVMNAYNGLVTLRNRYKNAYSQIDVQLQRRYDLIPNLVETAKGYMKHERETLEAVIAARNAAMTANSRASRNPGDPQAMQQLEAAEATLTGALGRLMVVSEAYPDLKADQTMTRLMEELTSTENKVAFARQAFNDSVTLYNTKREVFPSNLIATSFNFTAADLLEEAAPEVKVAPRISF
uniref:LemA family protein n=1 Tax=Oscillatoriales cyanobacterium SpSt-418 TaxID=2282169 RepID=A0A7C3KBX9_9CYAN